MRRANASRPALFRKVAVAYAAFWSNFRESLGTRHAAKASPRPELG